MKTDLPLDALEMALCHRGRAGQDVNGLVHHSDAGSQYTSIRYSQRLIDAGLHASIGTVGDFYDTRFMMVPVDAGSWSDPSYDWRTSRA